MVTVMYTFLFLGCSIALSVVAFLVGRCGRKLPIDGALPRVVHSVRFSHEPGDKPRSVAWRHGLSDAGGQRLRGIEPVPGDDDLRRRDG